MPFHGFACRFIASHIKCGVKCGVNEMKAAGPHPNKALSPAKVRTLSSPGRYSDGNGLYLVVDPSGAKRWLLRTVVQGKRADIGLGGLKTTSLADAREAAQKLRKIARDGGDPLENRRAAQRASLTFENAAAQVHASHTASWGNEKHKKQWIDTLKQYVFPHFGKKPLDKIDPADVLKSLSPIWVTKPETARRVLQRIRAVMDWAKASGHRNGDNPTDGIMKALPKQTTRRAHHAALPYQEIASYIKKMRKLAAGPSAKLALEFLVLTAARTNEVLQAKWTEIDLRKRTWTIPANRMKAKQEHRVPLSPRCLAILEVARTLSQENTYIFPGRVVKKPLSNMALTMLLRRMKLSVTVHGFRSTFRDWASEQTNFPNAVCEAALAHTIKDKVEAAYHRTDLFEKRRELMAVWTEYCTRK